MVDNNTSMIAESEYVFQEKAMQLMQNFFEINDTSLLKIGNLGYQTSLLTHAMRDGTFHRDALFNEQFLISASQNSTLYNWAKTVNYDISLSTPAHYDIGFKISINELKRISSVESDDSSVSTMIIDRATPFDLGGYKWLLPYEVIIRTSTSTKGTTSVTASYNFDKYNFKSPSIKTPYLKVMITSDDGVDYAVISLRIFQLVKREWIYTISSTDLLDSRIIDITFGNNIASFKGFYNSNATSLAAYGDLELIFNEASEPTSDTYGYYTLIGDDTLRIYFSSKSTYFHPAFNSKIKVETFTTSAEEGNFNYNGSISINSTSYDNISYSIIPLSTASTGGSSIKSFKDTKIALMEKLRTRDNYTTTYDLESYFSEVKKSEFSTGSDFQIVKLRDDLIRRQFTCYVLQRNNAGTLIPTNTVDMQFTLAELSNIGYSIKPGTLILYDRTTSTYRLLEDSELPEVYLKATDSYLFCVPYLINIDFKEFPKANIYLTNYEQTSSLRYFTYNVKNPYEIVMNNMTLSRNPMTNIDYFKFSAYINTTSVDIGNVKIRALLMQDGVAKGYFDLNRVGKTNEYSINVQTDDKFDSNGYYIIRDTVRDVDTNELISNFQLNGKYNVRIGVFITGTGVSTDLSNYPIYVNMSGLTNYGLICEFESEDNISFADDLSDIMYCQTIMNSTTGTVTLNKIPVIGALFYLNQYQNAEIMNDIFNYVQIVRNVASSLENNTTIDVKFFNTAGLSSYFDIDTIDIKLRLDIALHNNVSSTIDMEIKSEIVSFIENINSLNEKRFSISNLIKQLETKYSYIKYIKFSSVNGSNIQNIEQTLYAGAKTEDLPYDYVPEYLTIRKKTPDDISDTDYSYDIEINYI